MDKPKWYAEIRQKDDNVFTTALHFDFPTRDDATQSIIDQIKMVCGENAKGIIQITFYKKLSQKPDEVLVMDIT